MRSLSVLTGGQIFERLDFPDKALCLDSCKIYPVKLRKLPAVVGGRKCSCEPKVRSLPSEERPPSRPISFCCSAETEALREAACATHIGRPTVHSAVPLLQV